jgi:hypothetical protein
MYIRIPNILPYPHQERMFKAMVDDKNVCAVIHRRAGKRYIFAPSLAP